MNNSNKNQECKKTSMLSQSRLNHLFLYALITFLTGCIFQNQDFKTKPATEPLPTQTAIPLQPTPIENTTPLDPFNELVGPASDPTSVFTILVDSGPISTDYPGVLNVELTGRGILNLERIIYQQAEGETLVYSRDYVKARENSSVKNAGWPDGINKLFNVWVPESYFLTNGTDGDFVTAHNNSADDSILISGRYRLGPRDRYKEVYLVYEGPAEQPSRIYEKESGREIQATAGADFQAWNTHLTPHDKFVEKAAIDLSFDDAGRLVLEKRALPEGEYEIVFAVQTKDTVVLSEPTSLTVVPGQYSPELKTIVRPVDGFQFNLPQSWPDPVWTEDRLVAEDPLGQIGLSLSIHRGIGLNGPEDLGSMVLQNFGPVKVLYQDQVEAGGWAAIRTVYAYEGEDGAHTGIFFSTVRDGIGYVLDLDSSERTESEILKLADSIMDSWRFREAFTDNGEGKWYRVEAEEFYYYAPSEFVSEQLENGWHRSASLDGSVFFALRAESNSSELLRDQLDYWREVASQEAGGFHSSIPYEYELEDRTWLRFDFEYINSSGQRYSGFIAGTKVEDRSWFFWSEAPLTDFPSIYSDIYKLVMLSLNNP